MAITEYIARAVLDADGTWRSQLLADHLQGTARLAGEFAAAFGNRDWGELLGWWHDLGKFHETWQGHIRRQTGFDEEAANESAKGKINHSTVGAVHALLKGKESPPARTLAYILAGHHAGLPDWEPDEAGGDLCNRIYQNGHLNCVDWEAISDLSATKSILDKELPKTLPMGLCSSNGVMQAKEHFHLWIRMLFSCLVDADFLDTERFINSRKTADRGKYKKLSELKIRYDLFISAKERHSSATHINCQRKSIREKCMLKATQTPGFFSLTVPTGGGKTLSSLGFALEHALIHNKDRIIYAIPYTSIIEQTARIFKYGTDIDAEIKSAVENGTALFGEDQVVEHHSQIVYADDDNAAKLATENWDAPLIVTTNVQLFESLFASRTSACRKLHNIANSVIILDEVQTFPPDYLKPLLSILRGLVAYFGVTVVLMTATQPALEGRVGSPPIDFQGLENVQPIIINHNELTTTFDRVHFTFPKDLNEPMTWEAVRDALMQYEQVLCIVNTRKDCRDLHQLMPEGSIHLSALMCAEERSHCISSIKEKLHHGEPLRVISTQLVEAGVDIDFPVVYRALAGFDSIAQAAGRCNRENKLASQGRKGHVVIFVPPRQAPPGLLRKGEDACKEILRLHEECSLTSQIYKSYFASFYAKLNDVDKPEFYDHLVLNAGDFKFQFRTLAQHFQLIDDQCYQSIVVHYHDSRSLCAMLASSCPGRWLQRKLQRYMVNVPNYWLRHFVDHDMVTSVGGYFVQKSANLYKEGVGIQLDDSTLTEQMII